MDHVRQFSVFALCIGLAVTFVVEASAVGTLSRHMAQHLATMNLIAPAIAGLAVRQDTFHRFIKSPRWLWTLVIAQMVLLWGWHAPPVFAYAHDSQTVMTAMHASLFLAAYLFWGCLWVVYHAHAWHAIFALLVTGKLSCLLGALLVFAPRPLFELSHHGSAASVTLDDQHLAALIMLTACPLSYVSAAIWLTVTWFARLARPDELRGTQFRTALRP